MKLKKRNYYDEENNVIVKPVTLPKGFLSMVEATMKTMEAMENKEDNSNE